MSVHVFLGPSLPIAEARQVLPQAVYHPPAAVGDVYRVAASGDCSVLALIDGLFQSVPAVWHKEILFALELWPSSLRRIEYGCPACCGARCIWHGGRWDGLRMVCVREARG